MGFCLLFLFLSPSLPLSLSLWHPPWLGRCHNTLISARIQRLHDDVIMSCIVIRGLTSAITIVLDLHPPSRNGGPSSEEGAWVPTCRVI